VVVSRFPHAVRYIATMAAFVAAAPAALAAQSTDELSARLIAATEAYVESPIITGVSVAVVQGDDVLLQGGFGFVDLEWDVETPTSGEVSYEIGSVTKQFTSAAILLLVEEGKIDLDADFTEYLDFDTQGRSITVRRLLDHTSGIESYTDMPVFRDLSRFTLPRDTLVRLVEDEPFDFEPWLSDSSRRPAWTRRTTAITSSGGIVGRTDTTR
jgi:CubicO group peptidase (beta-lactamase class C family)